jgi:hypothetical protein
MLQPKERFIVDENGQRIGVLLDIEDYQRLLAELEELEAIRAYDTAKASGDEVLPLEQALAEIEKTDHDVHGFDPAPCAMRVATHPPRGL